MGVPSWLQIRPGFGNLIEPVQRLCIGEVRDDRLDGEFPVGDLEGAYVVLDDAQRRDNVAGAAQKIRQHAVRRNFAEGAFDLCERGGGGLCCGDGRGRVVRIMCDRENRKAMSLDEGRGGCWLLHSALRAAQPCDRRYKYTGTPAV